MADIDDGEFNLKRGTADLFESIVVTVLTPPYPRNSHKLHFKWKGQTLRVSKADGDRIRRFVFKTKFSRRSHIETLVEDPEKNTIRMRYRLGEV